MTWNRSKAQAQSAIDAIKNAINYVSDVRGTLGATQNRLEHTINNLSVMTENIQDAESTIRYVDIAEEMMADTGSDDGSREIAAKYADILFDFPWIDDFAAARNAVMDRCSGQWYFSIDADEWLTEDITELITFSQVKSLPQDFASVNIHNYNTVELDKTKQYNVFRARP